MTELWVVLTPILLADVLNPVLLGLLVYVAGGHRPVLKSLVALLGHMGAYFAAGVVLAYGITQITDRLMNPEPFDFGISLVLGGLLLGVALKPAPKQQGKKRYEDKTITTLGAFMFGVLVSFVGIPFALPYFAAVDQILKADLPQGQFLIVLVLYNLLYTLPFLIVPLLVAVSGARSRTLLQKINDGVDRASGVLMPLLLGALGLALVVDAVKYFVTGQGLF